MTKVALFCPPFAGGTYTTAARLRERGYDLRGLGDGRSEAVIEAQPA